MSKRRIEHNTKTAEQLTKSITMRTKSSKTSAAVVNFYRSVLDGCERLLSELLYRGYSKSRLARIFGVTYGQMKWFTAQRKITAMPSGIALKDLLTQSGIEV